MGERIEIGAWIEREGITMRNIRVESNPNVDESRWDKSASHWQCTFEKRLRPSPRLTVFFSQGSAHRKPPTAADVLDCLSSDAASVMSSPHFEEWASDMGYDTDSRKAERTFNLCKEQARKLKEFLGAEAFEVLLYKVERL